jgi:hypothetical protein
MINCKEPGINKIGVISGIVPKICREGGGNSFNVGNKLESGSFQIRSSECFYSLYRGVFLQRAY